jgi:hypothetical protein
MPIRAAVLWTVLALGAAACGDSGVDPSPDPPPVSNASPVIVSITVQGSGPREPAQYASLGETVTVTAIVTDAETPVAQLTYEWTSSVGGSFGGSGASVTWTAPAAAATPTGAVLTLTITERYGTNSSNRVTGTSTVNVHDSVKEVSDLARQFLIDFSDQVHPDVVMKNFTMSCPGAAEEYQDVVKHQNAVTVTSYTIGAPVTTVPFTGICPFRSRFGDACAQVPVRWVGKSKSTGETLISTGTDQVTAVLENNQWKLCASDFDGTTTSGFRTTAGLWFTN